MKPTLYLLLGYPGAGKTTAAQVIHELTGAVHLSSDAMRTQMFPKPTFDQSEHDALYQALDAKTEALLNAGQSVIYDANLNRHKHRADKYAICARTDAAAVLLWVQAPKELAKERAAHVSRLHLVPAHETPDVMFERIAGVIEEPGDNEPYTAVNGTKVTKDYIASLLK